MTAQDLWFTRATLKAHSPDVAPLVNTLLDGHEGRRINTTHRLLWTLMPEALQAQERSPGSDAKAAFLWREAPEHRGASAWYVLGPKPRDDAAFFDVESKPWAPTFSAGDRLAFDLVVNATVNRMVDPSRGRDGRQRADVVMDAIRAAECAGGAMPPRALLRKTLAAGAIQAWWTAQGERNGFRPVSHTLLDYRTAFLDRQPSGRGGQAQFGICRLTGVLEVSQPEAFAARVAAGFGRAKAFGCGLLLLKRQ